MSDRPAAPGPTVFLPGFAPAGGEPGARVLGFAGEDLLVDAAMAPAAPASLALLGSPEAAFGIGRAGGTSFELHLWPAAVTLPDSLQRAGRRALLGLAPAALADAACRARQLATWHRDHRHCGRCGAALETVFAGPARHCPACGLAAYPRISPVCIVLVTRGDEILLARSPHFPADIYSALAGFVEAGETVEACIHREVAEEVGIAVRDLRWFGSQSWPFPHSLMLGFHAEYAGGRLVPQAGEIEAAGWFSRDRLPPLPSAGTIARRMIEAWLAGG